MTFSSSDEGLARQPAIKTALKKRGAARKTRNNLPVKQTATAPIIILDETSSETETVAHHARSEPQSARDIAEPKLPNLVVLDDSDGEDSDRDDDELSKPVHKKQSTLSAFSGFKKLNEAEAKEQKRREMEELRHEAEEERAREVKVRNLKETLKREGARERKRKSRFSHKVREIQSGKRNSAGKIMKKVSTCQTRRDF